MSLLPGWKERLEGVETPPREAERRCLRPIPIDVPRAAANIHVVQNADSARALLDLLESIPLSAVALDSEYRFGRPGVPLRNGRTWEDVRSQRPICFSVAAWAEDEILRAVLDVRVPEVVEALGRLLRLRVPWVFHHAKVDLFSLWAVGVDVDLPSMWDTYLAAGCLQLGSHHRRGAGASAIEAETIASEALLAEQKAHQLSLVGQCERYGLAYPFSGEKDDLRLGFADMPDDEPLSPRQVEYASADAEWTLRLYIAQQADITRAGVAAHLHAVEFPFAVANARIEWNGVHVDPKRRATLKAAAENAASHYAGELRGHGIDPPGSRDRFLAVMRSAGHAGRFHRQGKPCTQDDLLETLENLHAAVRAFRLHQRYRRLASEEWLDGSLTGADGRIHPRHQQLGAATGRNSCSTPNLAGIGRVLRPVVTAPPGRAIIELDYAQVEVGVAAAEYGDSELVAAYNSDDVYVAMAKRFFGPDLSADLRHAAAGEFKRRRPDLRDQMKTFVLAVIYGVGDETLALRLGVPKREARARLERFLALFPALSARLEREVVFGSIRGHAPIVSGLRRRVERQNRRSSWSRNVLRNTPIQGSAAVVFKAAVVAMDRAFRRSAVLIVLPVHDSVVIECPLDQVDPVAATASRLMEDALRQYYPQLKPKVDVNASCPECWNKDGRADSLDRFLDDPAFRLDVQQAHADDAAPARPERVSNPIEKREPRTVLLAHWSVCDRCYAPAAQRLRDGSFVCSACEPHAAGETPANRSLSALQDEPLHV